MSFVTTKLLLFSVVEKEGFQEKSKIKLVSVPTLVLYVRKLPKFVESNVINLLPKKATLVIDGWNCSFPHYHGCFATGSMLKENVYIVETVSLSPVKSEASIDTDKNRLILRMF